MTASAPFSGPPITAREARARKRRLRISEEWTGGPSDNHRAGPPTLSNKPGNMDATLTLHLALKRSCAVLAKPKGATYRFHAFKVCCI
jgi:hypothetical protein